MNNITNNMKELIAEARSRIEEIAKATHNCLRGHETAIYVSENGYTISYLRRGHETRTDTITFGAYPMTKKEVEKIIDHMEELDEAWAEDMRYNANTHY